MASFRWADVRSRSVRRSDDGRRVRNLAAFGSRARQQALPDRDVDVAVILIWAEEFVRLCEHVHERRHLKDLRTHTCPHWAKAMQDAAEAQERRR